MLITREIAQKVQEHTGVLLGLGASLQGAGRFGSPSLFYSGSAFGLETSWGGYSYMVPPFSTKRLFIGNYSCMASYFIVAEDHPVDLLTTSPVAWRPWFPGCEFPGRVAYDYPATHIGSDVWIGTGVTVKCGVTIGDGSIIGAGAVVTHDIEPFTVAGGVPARPIRRRFSDALAARVAASRWWEHDWAGQPVDFSTPESALDDMERLLDKGFSRPFAFWRYAIQGERMVLSREGAAPGDSPSDGGRGGAAGAAMADA